MYTKGISVVIRNLFAHDTLLVDYCFAQSLWYDPRLFVRRRECNDKFTITMHCRRVDTVLCTPYVFCVTSAISQQNATHAHARGNSTLRTMCVPEYVVNLSHKNITQRTRRTRIKLPRWLATRPCPLYPNITCSSQCAGNCTFRFTKHCISQCSQQSLYLGELCQWLAANICSSISSSRRVY